MEILRYYTITLKPNTKSLKGDMKSLRLAYVTLLEVVGGQTEEIQFEQVDTDGLHLHALIKCPFIKSKYYISKSLVGYHLHTKIIKLTANKEQIKTTWNLYTQKEKSDSERYHAVFGNMFPLEELY